MPGYYLHKLAIKGMVLIPGGIGCKSTIGIALAAGAY